MSSPPRPPRRCVVLRGTATATGMAAATRLEQLSAEAVLWVGDGHPRFVLETRAGLRRRLGGSFDAVVLDMSAGLDADLLGQAQGFVRAGGWLLVRMPEAQDAGQARLAVAPFEDADVGRRFAARLEAALTRSGATLGIPEGDLPPADRATRGSPEQAALVDRLAAWWSGPAAMLALTADRGRGKSSALGLAVSAVRRMEPAMRVVISADDPRSTAEIFQFALGERTCPTSGPVRFCRPSALLDGVDADLVIIDEAAQLPVPLLQRIARAHPTAHLAFASTTRGYEGTGRGFVLRFLAWAAEQPRPLLRETLRTPIRYGSDDPLEAFVFDALALDAEPAVLPSAGAIETRALPKDELAANEVRLRETFGLLVHAHYRTTPADLHRLLDAPNLEVHVLTRGERVAAATLIAQEGALSDETVRSMADGSTRVRGHALADTLVCHLGHHEAGALRMIRSVRIASHPDARRLGYASRLVEHVHASYAPDLFGTLFSATPDVLAFRRALGYRLVRIGASRGARTGEPAAVMVRPVSPAARDLTTQLRAELARDLPLQLRLLDADDGLGLSEALRDSLLADLPAPASLSEAEELQRVRDYAFGPPPYEAVAFAVQRWVRRQDRSALASMPRAVVEGRVLAERGWRRVAEEAGAPSVPAAMRALRRAVRAMLA
ncbi:MAG: GNAT family N-acetyltransferase [Sandaracinaceae bacterium]